jgi:phospholipase/lecithinase/hemolysin
MTLVSKILFLLLCALLLTPLASARESSTWSYKSITFAGKSIKYISVPRDSSYEVVASVSNTGASLQSLIVQVSGVAGINGAYFIPRDYTKRPDVTNAPRIS